MSEHLKKQSSAMNIVSSEQRENLIEAYRTLHDSIYKRGATMQTVNTILLPTSIAVIGIAIEFRDSINSLFPFEIHAAGLVPLFSALLLLLAAFFTYTTGRINSISFDKIHEIEKTVGIEGHIYVYSKIKDTWWWKVRKAVWWTLLPAAIVICIISSYYMLL